MSHRIAVIGAGPAGLSAAAALHDLGLKVSLFEKFGQAQPLGSGLILQPTGQRVLKQLFGPKLDNVGVRLDSILGKTVPSDRTVLNVNYQALGDTNFGIGIHRASLFDLLLAECEKRNIQIHTACQIKGLVKQGSEYHLQHELSDTLGPFDFVIDASGRNSNLVSQYRNKTRIRSLPWGALWTTLSWPNTGFDTSRLEQRYEGAHAMIGVLPVGHVPGKTDEQLAFFWSLKTQDYGQWKKQTLQSWKNRILEIWPECEPITDQIHSHDQMTLANYTHHTLKRPYHEGLIFVGDAAHATSPQLGQGANMALLDVLALVNAFRQSKTDKDVGLVYGATRKWHIRFFQAASLALTPFYQSDSRLLASLRDWTFDPVSRLPIANRLVAGLVAGTLGNPFKKLG